MIGGIVTIALLAVSSTTDSAKAFEFPPGIIPLRSETSRFSVGYIPETDSGLHTLNTLVLKADSGDAQAQFELGTALLNGRNVRKNEPLAVLYFQRSALKNHPGAQFNLGLCYENGFGCDVSLPLAARCYQHAAPHFPQAMFNWALCLKSGIPAEPHLLFPAITQDLVKAETILHSLAGKGFIPAKRELAVLWLASETADSRYAQALTILNETANQNDPVSYRILGNLALKPPKDTESDPKKALSYFQKAAAMGDAEAMAKIGWCYEKGVGTDPDTSMAIRAYESAADGGQPIAMTALANHYLHIGGVKNVDKALSLLLLASRKGDPTAMCMLGVCSWQGIGQKIDFPAAERMFTGAAKLGNAPAQYNLAMMHLEKQTLNPDPKLAVQWLGKASEANHTDAMVRFSLCLLNGIGCSPDPEYGMLLMRKAARLGNAEALKMINTLLETTPSL